MTVGQLTFLTESIQNLDGNFLIYCGEDKNPVETLLLIHPLRFTHRKDSFKFLSPNLTSKKIFVLNKRDCDNTHRLLGIRFNYSFLFQEPPIGLIPHLLTFDGFCYSFEIEEYGNDTYIL